MLMLTLRIKKPSDREITMADFYQQVADFIASNQFPEYPECIEMDVETFVAYMLLFNRPNKAPRLLGIPIRIVQD